MKSENKARVKPVERARRDEGKVCRVCIGKVAKLLNSYKKEEISKMKRMEVKRIVTGISPNYVKIGRD